MLPDSINHLPTAKNMQFGTTITITITKPNLKNTITKPSEIIPSSNTIIYLTMKNNKTQKKKKQFSKSNK